MDRITEEMVTINTHDMTGELKINDMTKKISISKYVSNMVKLE